MMSIFYNDKAGGTSDAGLKSIQSAIILLWITYGLDRLRDVLSFHEVQNSLEAATLKFHSQFYTAAFVLFDVVAWIIFPFLIMQISKRKRWARNIYLMVVSFDLMAIRSHFTTHANLVSYIELSQDISEVCAMLLLYTKSARTHFSNHSKLPK